MKQEDKWFIKFRNRMDGYTEMPPSDIWKRLDEELSFNTANREKSKRFFIATMVAIFLLLISAGFYFFIYDLDNQEIKITDVSSRISDYHNPNVFQEKISVNRNDKIAYMPIERAEEIINKEKEIDYFDIKVEKDSVRQLADTVTTFSEKESEDISDAKDVLYNEESEFSKRKSDTEKYKIKKVVRKNRGWSVGVSVGNSMIASAENHYGFSNLDRSEIKPRGLNLLQVEENKGPEEQKAALAYQQIMFKNINLETTTNVKHHFPVSFGLSLRKDLSDRISLETGLVYTLLTSDLKAGGDIYYSQEQKLHYLGIPLKVGCYFVKKKRLSLYLSAGGMIEKCIKSQLKTRYEMQNEHSFIGDNQLDADGLQWSVLSSLGAQFNITNYLGLYVEPGVAYYFDDGTNVSTIRKEKPFNFNLQIGLRLGF